MTSVPAWIWACSPAGPCCPVAPPLYKGRWWTGPLQSLGWQPGCTLPLGGDKRKETKFTNEKVQKKKRRHKRLRGNNNKPQKCHLGDVQSSWWRNKTLERRSVRLKTRTDCKWVLCKCVFVHNSSTTIKIDVTENRLHHGFIEPFQSLQTEKQTMINTFVFHHDLFIVLLIFNYSYS